MRVKLKVRMTGTRNGEDWPDYNEEMELPDQEARDMIMAGMAEPVVTFRDAEKAIPDAPETRERRLRVAK